MNFTIKKNTKVAVMAEASEGVEQAIASGADYLQTLEDGFSLETTREQLDRAVLIGSIGRLKPLLGMRSATVSLSCEAKGPEIAGDEPEYGLLVEGALGDKHVLSSQVTTKSSGNTASSLKIEDADIADFRVGQIIKVLQSGAHHHCAITAVDATLGAAAITVTPARTAGNFANSVVIEKGVTYCPANSDHQSFTVVRDIESSLTVAGKHEKATGCKVASMALSGFETGGLAQFDFSLEGMGYDVTIDTDDYAPEYDGALPFVALKACVYVNGVQVDVNSFSVNLTNTLAGLMSTCSENGKFAQRVSAREVSGEIDPYKTSDSTTVFDRFDSGTEFSLFVHASNPGASAGTTKQSVCFYLPKCMITSLAEGDQDGNLQDTISFVSTRGADGETDELFIGFM